MIKKTWNTKKLIKEKPKSKIHWRFKLYVALAIVCIVGVVYVLRLPEYQVSKVVVEDLVLTKESDITDIADEYLGYSYFYFVPQSNVWLYPKEKILKAVLALPSIDDVDLYLDKDTNALHIKIKEKKHEYVWCDASNICFYMNKDGYIFAPSPTFEGNVFLTFRGLITDEPLGKNFLPKVKMNEVIGFTAELRSIGFNVSSVNIISNREVNIVLDQGAMIIVSIDGSLQDTLKNIKTLIASEDFKNASGGIAKVQYIDMRYGKKAFWR